MARLSPGRLLIVVGAATLAGSVTVLLIVIPGLGAPYPPSPSYQLIATVAQLAWFFIFFGSIMIFMGIRRASPLVARVQNRG